MEDLVGLVWGKRGDSVIIVVDAARSSNGECLTVFGKGELKFHD